MSDRGRVLFDHVWKRFHRGPRYDSLRELLPAMARAVTRIPGAPRRDAFWALADVSFEVTPGEALGIIGPNGAGKSTVLRLLCRLLRAERGRAEVRGRVGALIELAAGFHPDLTGRENVYLQGAIMGMRRVDIARQFDAIVEFAGVEPFIDTPIKRYSSGMNARLGFAIAAHLDPDVLLVDEVLSVGDLAFQRRASERLAEMVRRQVPVVLVSHQLDRILELCPRALLLVGGRVVRAGPAAECIAAYVEGAALAAADGPASPVILEALACAADSPVAPGDRLTFALRGRVAAPLGDARVGVQVHTLPEERPVFGTHHAACGVVLPREGPFALEIDLAMNLGPGTYRAFGVVWNGAKGEWARGPSVVVQVTRDPANLGRVFAAPRMRLLAP